MPRKFSSRKSSPQPTETQPATPEVAAIRASTEKHIPQAEPMQAPASGPVLVGAETGAPRKPLMAQAEGTSASLRSETIDKPASQVVSSSQQEAIRKRAFEIYQQRGRTSGNAVDDWLRAERELLAAAKSKKDKRQPA
jgi:Protein of unknown function (DUF2934)